MAEKTITRESLIDEAIALARKLERPERQAQALLAQVYRLRTPEAQLDLMKEAAKAAASVKEANLKRQIEADIRRQAAAIHVRQVAAAKRGADEAAVQKAAKEAKAAIDAMGEDASRIDLLGSLADALS